MTKKKVSPKIRSRTMRSVRSKDTRLELLVRKALHSAGLRYRLHRRDLPGCPDVSFGKTKVAVFINGCFWHQHSCRRGNRKPKSNQTYWLHKLERTIERDRLTTFRLVEMGWRVATIWECQTDDIDAFVVKVTQMTGTHKTSPLN